MELVTKDSEGEYRRHEIHVSPDYTDIRVIAITETHTPEIAWITPNHSCEDYRGITFEGLTLELGIQVTFNTDIVREFCKQYA